MNFLSLQASFYSRHFLFVCLTPASLFFTLLQPFNKGAKKRLGFPFIWIGITNIEDCFFLFNQRNFDKIWIFRKESQIGHETNSQIFFDEHKSYLGYNKRGWDKSPSLSIIFGLSSKTQWLSGLYYADFIRFYSPTQLCGGGTTKSNSNELPISVPLSLFFRRLLYPIFDRFLRPNRPLHLP